MKWIYYKLWQDFTGGRKDNSPALYSMMWLSCIQCVNVLTLVVFLSHFFKFNIILLTHNKIVGYSSILAISIMILNFFLLYKKRKAISEKYKNESNRLKIIGFILLYIYMIGSFVLAYAISQVFPMK